MAVTDTAHELARIAERACDELITHFEKMSDKEFFRQFDGLEGSDLFSDIPTGLEWLEQRYYNIQDQVNN